MTLNEMSTAVQHGATPIVIVVNNGRYGTIRMHQEKHYPAGCRAQHWSTRISPLWPSAYGGHGERVTDGAAFPAAFARAQAAGKLAVIEIVVDSEALSTGMTLSATRAAAVAARP
jgi:acetolactate synthase I/II/III large subunit